jgi:hypothetical protein
MRLSFGVTLVNRNLSMQPTQEEDRGLTLSMGVPLRFSSVSANNFFDQTIAIESNFRAIYPA